MNPGGKANVSGHSGVSRDTGGGRTTRLSAVPLRVAVVGCGKVARKHLQAILAMPADWRLAALVDNRPDAPAQLLATLGRAARRRAERVPVYLTLDQLLTAEPPDVVAITTPSGTHFALAAAALRAGCHVFVEKPLALSTADCAELLRLAESAGRQIAVGHIYRFFPAVQELAQDLRQGCLGRVLYGTVAVRWGHDQAYYDQAGWRGTWAQDGGALMNQTVHALDLMCYLLGGEPVEAGGTIARQAHQLEAEDLALGWFTLDNGTLCQVEGTTVTDPESPEATFAVFATGGEIRAGIRGGRMHFSVRQADPAAKAAPGSRQRRRSRTIRVLWRYFKRLTRDRRLPFGQGVRNPHAGIYRDFSAAIRDGRTPLAGGQTGATAVQLALALYQAAREGRSMQLKDVAFDLSSMRGWTPNQIRERDGHDRTTTTAG